MTKKKKNAKAAKVAAKKPAKLAVRKCAICGKTFTPKAVNQLYCSAACKRKARQVKERSKAIAAGKAVKVTAKKPLAKVTAKKPADKKPVTPKVACAVTIQPLKRRLVRVTVIKEFEVL